MKQITLRSDGFIRTGLRHLDMDQPCQDYILAVRTRGRGTDLFIDCDGISSCKNAEAGSKVVAHTVAEYFTEKAADKAFIKALLSSPETMTKQIAAQLDARNKEALKDIPKADTTLTFVWVISEQYALAGSLGDSAVCIFSDKGASVMTQTRDHGGATESVRVCRADQMDIRLIDLKAEQVKGFLLTSDGLEGLLYTKGKRTRALHICEDFVNTLFEDNGHDQIERYLDQVCADSGFDDDISLIIAAFEPITVEKDPTWLCPCGARNSLFSTRCEQCGRDYLSLYRTVDMAAYPSVWDYFRYLNAHPEEERALIEKKQPDPQKVNRLVPHQDEDSDDIDYIEYRYSPDRIIEDTATEDPSPKRAPAHNTSAAHEKQARHRQKGGSVRIPMRFAVIGSAVAVLLCGVLAVNFFQMLSISNTLQEMRAEIDSLKEERVAQTAKVLIQAPTEHRRSSAVKATEPPTEAPTEPVAETAAAGLAVTEVVALYPEPSYFTDAVGSAVPDSDITLLSRQTVDDTRWVQVQLANGDTGWAPDEYFHEISRGEDTSSRLQAEKSADAERND